MITAHREPNTPEYNAFLDGMEAAAQICGSLAETTYDDTDAFEGRFASYVANKIEAGENDDDLVALLARHRESTHSTLLAENARLRAALRSIIDHFNDREQAPGHCHDRPGIWDFDNPPDRAGTPCDWCAEWSNARAALKGDSHG